MNYSSSCEYLIHPNLWTGSGINQCTGKNVFECYILKNIFNIFLLGISCDFGRASSNMIAVRFVLYSLSQRRVLNVELIKVDFDGKNENQFNYINIYCKVIELHNRNIRTRTFLQRVLLTCCVWYWWIGNTLE